MVWKILLILFIGVVAVQHVITFIYIMGYHKHVFKHRPGHCAALEGIDYGAEDIEYISDGLALIASGYVRTNRHAGCIHAFNFSSPQDGLTRVNITGNRLGEFHPIGLSKYVKKSSSRILLFVVNQNPIKDSIEIFEFKQDGRKMLLRFVRRLQSPLMRCISDVQAVGPGQFYLTNGGYNKEPTLRMLEHYMMFPWGGAIFCDGEACRAVSNPLYEPSSIQMSADGRFIYVSLLYGMGLQIYARDASDNNLSVQTAQTVNLGTLVDTVFVDSFGNLWTANHPVAHKLEAHRKDRRKKSPSQVLQIKFNPGPSLVGANYEVSEVYSDDGTQLSASSSLAFHQNQLLIGSRRNGLLLCDVLAAK